jgi:hypothetical protein
MARGINRDLCSRFRVRRKRWRSLGKVGRKSFFFEKRTKKLLNPGPSLSGKAEAKFVKVFLLLFFQKKKAFLQRTV